MYTNHNLIGIWMNMMYFDILRFYLWLFYISAWINNLYKLTFGDYLLG